MIVSSTVHVATVCGTVMLKYSFTSQNPPSFTCEAMSEPAPIATTISSLLTSGIAVAIGAMMLAAVTQATVAEPTDRRSSAAITHAEHERRELQAAHRLRDGRVGARDVEHAAEPASGADDQEHARDRRQRFLREPQQPGAVEAARLAERVEREERREQHRHERAACAERSIDAALPSGMTACASDASSISTTGSRIVSSVTPSEGIRAAAVLPVSWSAIAPASTCTRRLMKRPNSGPEIIATGRPTMSE